MCDALLVAGIAIVRRVQVGDCLLRVNEICSSWTLAHSYDDDDDPGGFSNSKRDRDGTGAPAAPSVAPSCDSLLVGISGYERSNGEVRRGCRSAIACCESMKCVVHGLLPMHSAMMIMMIREASETETDQASRGRDGSGIQSARGEEDRALERRH